MATFAFMFLVKDRLVWWDKTLPRALELWYTWCTLLFKFLSVFKELEIIIFRRQHARTCPRCFHWNRHLNGLNYPIKHKKRGSNFKLAPKLCIFLYSAMEATGVHQGMGIIHSDVMDTVSIVVMHGTLNHKTECRSVRSSSFRVN